MALRERTIPCSDVPEWKHDLELTGYHVIDSNPDPDRPGFCMLRFDIDHDVSDVRAVAFAPATAAAAPDATTLSPLQVSTAHAIINVFETGIVLGRYGQVTILPGDTGRLTFGRSQTTLGSGNLGKLIDTYCKTPGARFAARLSPYLQELNDRFRGLDEDDKLHNLLRATADDPVMRTTQDTFFDRGFWQPAAAEAARMNIHSALGVATVYDSWVHGSWSRMRDLTIDSAGALANVGEHAWITAYIAIRRKWLGENAQPILRGTVYRMDALQALAQQQQWSLNLPLVVRNQEISASTLSARPSDCYDGPAPGSRLLTVAAPLERGLDVRLVQLGLSDADVSVTADGVFGGGTAQSIKQYQKDHGLPVTGIADLALIAHLTA